jgi:hypothetical protein
VNNLDKIAELWAKGLTTAVIGERVGIPKNSVCRLAYEARIAGDARFPARALRPVPKSKGVKPRVIMRPVMPRRKRPPYSGPKPRALHPFIYELKPGECRYAVTSIDMARDAHRFCAKPQAEGSSYCAEHYDLCRGTLKPRVRP